MRTRVNRVVSMVMVILILLSVVQPSGVVAVEPEEANFMAGKMISYFSGAIIEDISTISPEELRVYTIFLSNFFKPGQTKLGELKSADSQVRKDVEGALFPGGMGDLDKEQFNKLNELMYKSIDDGLSITNEPYRLKDSSGANLTGLKLKEMMAAAMKDKAKNKHTIKYGGGTHLDLQDEAVRGAFKLLAGYNLELMFDKTGIEAYDNMFVDGYGNIWASTGEVVWEELTLVMPAAINPAAFSGGKYKKADRLPLNNAFGLGASVAIKQTSEAFKGGFTGYYNLQEDIITSSESKNALQIWGLTGPLPTVGDSSKLTTGNYNGGQALKDYYKDTFFSIDPKNTKVMLNIAANEGVDTRIGNSLKASAISKEEKGPLVYYLAGSLAVPIGEVQDTMYYSTSFAESEISKLGGELESMDISGQSMYTQDDGTKVYGDSAANNAGTDKLGDFIGKLGGNESYFGKSTSDAATVKAYKEMGALFIKEMGETDGTEVVTPTPGGTELVKKLSGSSSAPFQVTKGESAVLFLTGNIYYSIRGNDTENIIPSAIKTRERKGIVEKGVGNTVTSMRYQDWNLLEKGWVYGMTERDAHLWLGLYHNKTTILQYRNQPVGKKIIGPLSRTFDDGMVIPKGEFKDNANSNVFIQTHIFKVFGPHKLPDGGTPAGTSIKIGGVDRKQDTRVANTNSYWPGIFLAYLDEVVDLGAVATGGAAKNFNSSYLPEVPKVVQGGFEGLGTSSISEEGASDFDPDNMEKMQKDLLEKIYGIVSDKPNAYRDRWLKSTIDGVLITLHKTLTGSWFGDMQTVSTGTGSTYTSIAGYIHTPTLEDLPFTEWVTANYMNIYMLFMLIIVGLLTIMVLTRMRTVYQGIAIFCIMSVALMLPSILITNTVNISNKASDRIYSERFDFWAMTQHQTSLDSIATYTGTSAAETMIANTMQRAEEVYAGDAGVRLKWMSPKKADVFNGLYSQIDMSESFVTNIQIFKWLFNSFIYDSEFVRDDPLSTYLYRPYNSLAREAENYYKMGETILKDSMDTKEIINVTGVQPKTNETVTTPVESYKVWADIYKRALTETEVEGTTRRESLFKAGVLDDEIYTKNNYTSIYYGEHKQDDIKAVSPYRYSDATVGSIALWGVGNTEVIDTIFKEAERVTQESSGESGVTSNLVSEIDYESLSEEEANLSAYLKNTESPFYYFYATLKHRYGEDGGSFKQALLNRDIYRVYNTELAGYEEGEKGLKSTHKKVDGMVRDFLDLEGLFTYTVPYLTASNDYVYDWTKKNGTSVSAYNFDREVETMSAEDLDKYNFEKKKKDDMGRVWNMYSPWVDQMNALSTVTQRVKVGGTTVLVENTLNPGAYLEKGRPMLFSEADMVAKGYTEAELSDVERRMHEVLRTTYKDMMYLVNYYDMKDEVLINAAAMYATFNFNREFSQTNIVGESTMIYPQSFEMQNFNYDAYMQLIMLNATGERINDTQDLYTRILSKTSSIAGVLLIVSDVIGIIIIPTLKIVILLSLLFLGLTLCLVMAINPPEKIFEAVMNSLMIPAILFMTANIVFALVISFFVGEGLTAYVGTKGISVSTNDPTVTLLLVGVIGAIYSVALWKILMRLIKSCKEYGVATALAGVGVISGAVIGVSHKISEVTGKAIGTGTTAGSARATRAKAGGSGIAGEGEDYNPYRHGPLQRKEEKGVGGSGAGAVRVAKDIKHKASIGSMNMARYAAYRAGGKVEKYKNKMKGVISGRNKGKEDTRTETVENRTDNKKHSETINGYEKKQGVDYDNNTGFEQSMGASASGAAYIKETKDINNRDRVVNEDLEREGVDLLRQYANQEVKDREEEVERPSTQQEVKERDRDGTDTRSPEDRNELERKRKERQEKIKKQRMDDTQLREEANKQMEDLHNSRVIRIN